MKDTKGFSLEFLEAYLHQLSDKEDWETFIDVLMFPSFENSVDHAAIVVFIAFNIRSERPVTTILADIYIEVDLC